MHAIPEKLTALRQQIEATTLRRLQDTREELEVKMAESCKASEDQAIERCSAQLKPLMKEQEAKYQAQLAQVQMAADQSPPRIQETVEKLNVMKQEVAPLYSRADAAAARLDRLGVQCATISKDCSVLQQEFKDTVKDLRARHMEQDRKREDLEKMLRAFIESTAGSARQATEAATARSDDQFLQLRAHCEAFEQRMRLAMDELEQRARREANNADEGVINKLRPEILGLEGQMRQKVEECNAQAERLSNLMGGKLREEIDTACKRTSQQDAMTADLKIRELSLKHDKDLVATHNLIEATREGADVALRDQVLAVRASVAEHAGECQKQFDGMRQQVISVENRCFNAAEQAKLAAVDKATVNLDETAKAMRQEMEQMQRDLSRGDDTLRSDLLRQLQSESAKLSADLEKMGSHCNSSLEASIAMATAQYREALAAASKENNERTDAARLAAAEGLAKEAATRQQGLSSADMAREALARALREELRTASHEAQTRLDAAVSSANQRHDGHAELIKDLQRGLQAAVRDGQEAIESFQHNMKGERQLTEEGEAELGRKLQQARDQLEARLQNEVSDVRRAIGECQKRLHEEGTELRKQLREKSDKQEVATVAKSSQECCEEVTVALNSHRDRLETVVGDFGARYREVTQEVNDSRLRVQREAIALGGEVTQLRAACTSLANGTLKAMQVVGILGPGGSTAEELAMPGSPAAMRGVEVDDLLTWEKSGKSLAVRIEGQWRKQEMAGFPSVLSMIERACTRPGAASEHLAQSPGLGDTWGALSTACSSRPETRAAADGSLVPTKPSCPPTAQQVPESVREYREKRTN
eukprot:TRINITY_DN9644_c0_g1_i1.p1 TRINITY_DN9644_c0_g1~~TRINITY_DN9644_c0_g1_i1.p1  ORF type:complete len:822 (+),score=274.73 TRINITY_DN9644_c0_g1_i1:91-2556(+)